MNQPTSRRKITTRSDNAIYSNSTQPIQNKTPRWAELIAPKDTTENQEADTYTQKDTYLPKSIVEVRAVNIVEKEFQLRTKAYLSCLHQIEQAYSSIYETHSEFQDSTMIPLKQFLNSFIPMRRTLNTPKDDIQNGKQESDSQPPSCKRQRTHHNKDVSTSTPTIVTATVTPIHIESNDLQTNTQHSLDSPTSNPLLQEKTTIEPQSQTQPQHHFHDPTRLPVIMIQSYTADSLDRSNLVRYLARSLSNMSPLEQEKPYHSAVCILNGNRINSKTTSKQTLLVKDLIYHILWQCISLEEAQVKRHMSNIQSWKSPILPKHHKTARRSNISAVETLLRWTRSTKYFDSIVVLFEDPEVISLAILDELVETLSNLRFLHGIPISLILTPTVGNEISMLSRSSMSNVVLKELDAPDSKTLLNHMMNELFVESSTKDANILPVMLAGDCLQKIESMFEQYHYSVTIATSHIKAAISLFFSKKGSLLASLLDSSFTSRHAQESKELTVNAKNRSILTATKYDSQSPISLEDLLHNLYTIQVCTRTFHISICLLKILLDYFDPERSMSAHLLLRQSLLQSNEIPNVLLSIHTQLESEPWNYEQLIDFMKTVKWIVSEKLEIYENMDKDQVGDLQNIRSTFEKKGNIQQNQNVSNMQQIDPKNTEKELLSDDAKTESNRNQISGKTSLLLEKVDECIILLDHISYHHQTQMKNQEISSGRIELDAEIKNELSKQLNSYLAYLKDYIIDAQDEWFKMDNLTMAKKTNINNAHSAMMSSLHHIMFKDKCFLSHEEDDGYLSNECPIMARPRQAISCGLLQPHFILHCNCCSDISAETYHKMHDTCLAYHIMTDRHINQSDWFELFRKAARGVEEFDIWNRFVFALYELLHCGIVKRTRNRGVKLKDENSYERVMVWTNGS